MSKRMRRSRSIGDRRADRSAPQASQASTATISSTHGLPETVVARLLLRLRALAAGCRLAPCGLVLLRLRRRGRDRSSATGLAGRPSPAGTVIRMPSRVNRTPITASTSSGTLPAARSNGDAGLRALELLTQGFAVHARHHSASTFMIAARSPPGARPAASSCSVCAQRAALRLMR